MDYLEEAMIKKENEIKELIMKLRKCPIGKSCEGHLRVARHNGKASYYYVDDRVQHPPGGTYIPKRYWSKAKEMAQAEYFEKLLTMAEKEYSMIKRWQKAYKAQELIELYEKMADSRKQLVDPYVISDEEYASKWQSESYEGKGFNGDTLEIFTERGERVRSKSEKMIADKLHIMGVPYKYEYPLFLAGYGTVYPDFTMLRVKRRDIVIYEHFGMMDDPEYADRALRKIELYERNGFFPGDNLMITHETGDRPLNLRTVTQMIERIIF